MMNARPKDRAASVRARLLNLSRQRGEDFQITLRNYLFERFLYRLGRSPLRERFVLKGTPIPVEPPLGLTSEYWSQPGRDAQVRAFIKRARLDAAPQEPLELGIRVAEFAIPLLKAASEVEVRMISAS